MRGNSSRCFSVSAMLCRQAVTAVILGKRFTSARVSSAADQLRDPVP